MAARNGIVVIPVENLLTKSGKREKNSLVRSGEGHLRSTHMSA